MRKIFQFKHIKSKMLFGFSLVIVFVIFFGIYNFYTSQKVSSEMKNIANKQLPLLIADEKLAFNISQRLTDVRGYLLLGDQKFRDSFNTYTEESEKFQEDILSMVDSKDVKQLIDQSIEWENIIIDEVFATYERGDKDEAIEILDDKATPLAEEIMKDFVALNESREDIIHDRADQIVSSGETNIIVSIVVAIVIVILSVLVALITSNMIAKPIRTVMDRMKLIADGQLNNEPIETSLKDEVGQLIEATNDMNDQMRTLLRQIQDVSETVSSQSEELTQSANEVMSSSEQVASTMQDLSSGAESQSNHASELSNIVATFTTKIEEANNRGLDIQKSSQDVLEMTNNGYALMEKSTAQMDTIDEIVRGAVENVQTLNSQSQKISELVAVIEDIAEQTNLLALNAAIEAARAGEHGQGFAVVADEVRKLAEGVSHSVTDITDIVSSIQRETDHVTGALENGYEEVKQGTEQITSTGEAFSDISTAVQEMVRNIQVVSDNLSDISGESQEMNSSIQEVAAISEESAAGVEETSAASEQTSSAMQEVSANSNDLAKLAEKLNSLVRQFKL